jgi:xanthine dehydrogenase accessory factor
MKEIRSIVAAWQGLDLAQTKAALATVVRVEGSSYRRAGARMLVLDDGTYLGGISGGCLEGDALRRAQKGIALQRPSVITYDTTQDDDYQIGVGLGCQGIIDVLFTPLKADDARCPLRTLAGLTAIRRPAVLITVIGGSDQQRLGATWLYGSDSGGGTQSDDGLRTEIEQALAERQSRTVIVGESRYFIEIILPAVHIAAYGASYDIHTLRRQVVELGWDFTLVNKRNPQQPVIDDYTAVLLMSHDYNTDKANLELVLPSAAGYIGILGPHKRADKLFSELAVGEDQRARIYAPAGLDIGAATPEEIALSILAEVRSHFARRKGCSLRYREGSIYS